MHIDIVTAHQRSISINVIVVVWWLMAQARIERWSALDALAALADQITSVKAMLEEMLSVVQVRFRSFCGLLLTLETRRPRSMILEIRIYCGREVHLLDHSLHSLYSLPKLPISAGCLYVCTSRYSAL